MQDSMIIFEPDERIFNKSNSLFPIIKNAGTPPRVNRGKKRIYPFHEMKKGDAFDAPDDMGVTTQGVSKRLASIKASAHRSSAGKFSCRKIGNKIRCWKV